jgi:predicted phosphodiesterase
VRIAIVSDIHGNLTALQAVLADIRLQSPDLVLQGGDLVYGGCAAQEIIELISDLGVLGVVGNTDEALWDSSGLQRMRSVAPKLAPLFRVIEECAAASRAMLDGWGLHFLQQLPAEYRVENLRLLHASPGDTWKAPLDSAEDAALRATYGALNAKIVVYGHIHRAFIRPVDSTWVCNSGSVGMPYDGDPRASYLQIEDGRPTIRRVPYDVEEECARLLASDYPFKAWLAEIRRRGAYFPPPSD